MRHREAKDVVAKLESVVERPFFHFGVTPFLFKQMGGEEPKIFAAGKTVLIGCFCI